MTSRSASSIPRLSLTVDEAAACLGIGRTSFYKHVMPELRVLYVGKKPLIPAAELERYLDREARPASIDELTALRRGGRVR